MSRKNPRGWLASAAALALCWCWSGTGCSPQKREPPPEIRPLEPYSVRARVLSKTEYGEHWAPVDVFLCWGELLDRRKTEGVVVQQGDRMGWWFPPKDSGLQGLNHLVANTHLIADDEEMRQKILEISKGDQIYVEGALVEVRLASGKKMKSSLSRTDRGLGACEVLLVKKLEILP